MAQVYIRFLHHGALKVEIPDGFSQMTSEEKMRWAMDVLNDTSDDDLLGAMRELENNGFFAETPLPAAIEHADNENVCKTIVQTKEWETYTSQNGQDIVEVVDEKSNI
jgi:hypothetical protein